MLSLNHYFWNEETFNFKPPKNWNEIMEEANQIIRDVEQDTECNEAALRCSLRLWENFIKTNRVGNVIGIW